MRFLVYRDLDVRMLRLNTRTAGDDALQPRIAVIFLLRLVIVVCAPRAVLIVGVATAKQIARTTLASQKVR